MSVVALPREVSARPRVPAALRALTRRKIMRVMDGLMAFPAIILAIALMASLGPSVTNVIVAIGVVYMPRVARVVRGSVLVVRETAYVEAARALGVRDVSIILRHVLPNCL